MKKMDTQFLTNKTVINVTKEPSDANKKPSKKKYCKKSLRNPWRRY
jgi:hypothetical protein